MKLYAVIMAGGLGTRFWPLSRQTVPKQTLALFSEKTLIQETVDRVHTFIPREQIIIITNQFQIALLRSQLPVLPSENFIVEPYAKNTAPAIALGCLQVVSKNTDAVIVVLPADHLITGAFEKTITAAAQFAYTHESIVTVGVVPSRPETGYGYIYADRVEENFFKVKSFKEKPTLETAKKYLQEGNHYWNAGIFVFRPEVMIAEFKKFLPKMFSLFQEYDDSNAPVIR